MNERPILFSGEMVRAILAGKKTQTRRVVKPQPIDRDCIIPDSTHGFIVGRLRDSENAWRPQRCPYEVGLRLWVRETFWQRYREGWTSIEAKDWVRDSRIAYLTDHPERPNEEPYWWKKVPGIHMRRDQSRLTLEVTGVRVERLQEISEEDAIAEGVETDVYCANHCDWRGPESLLNDDDDGNEPHCPKCDSNSAILDEKPVETFQALWDSINGKSHPWESNPFVWVVEFKQVAAKELP